MRRLILALAIVSASAVLSFRPVYEPDLGWHLAHGREIAAGRLPHTNVFSSTYPDYRQHYTSWLFDAAAYVGVAMAGDIGVQILQTTLLVATFALLYAACRRRSDVLPAIAVLALGFMVLEPRAIPRPHLASFAALAACVWLIEKTIAARSARPLIWAVPLVALWSNLHSESLFGVAAVGLFAIAELVRPSALPRREALRAVAIASACGVALLANLYGWGLLRYLFENSSLPQLMAIAELRPAYWPAYAAFFVYLAVAAILLAVAPRQGTLRDAVLLLVFGALGWRYLRLTPLVFLVTAPFVAASLTSWTKARRGIDGRAILVTAVAVCVMVSRVPLRAYVTGLDAGTVFPPSIFSPRAVAFVRDHGLRGPLFNSNNLGGWIEWTLYPDVRVFQDSRLQAYPPEHFERIMAASRSQDLWNTLVADVDWAMLSTARPSALSGAGRFPPDAWATVFWDEAIQIAVRRAGQYAALADRNDYRILRPDSELFELAPALTSNDRDRLLSEARRNLIENPEGFAAAAVLCVSGDASACATAERTGASWSTLDDDLVLMRALKNSGAEKVPATR